MKLEINSTNLDSCAPEKIMYLCIFLPILFLSHNVIETLNSLIFNIKNSALLSQFFFFRWFHGEHCDLEEQLSRRYLALLEGKEDDLEESHDSSYYVGSVRRFFSTMR